ncbi:MAG: transcriptional repressor [Eubacteriales bacterium]
MVRKQSKQRVAILQYLQSTREHPTADVVYSNLRQELPNISLGTVYRNLSVLADSGDILRLNLGDGTDRFDYRTEAHYHFICEECGAVMDLELEDIPSVTHIARDQFDGHIAGHTTYFHGICPSCLAQH